MATLSEGDRDLMDACLALSKASMVLFDEIERDGSEGGFTAEGAMALVGLAKSFELIRAHYARRATARMLALGVTPQQLARMDKARRT